MGSITNMNVTAQKTSDAFTLASVIKGVASDGFDWVGANGKTIVVASNSVATMNDYSTSGATRFGTPAEVENTTQEMACAKDRSFSFTVDKMGAKYRGGTYEAGRMLRKQIDEVVTPEIDVYALGKLVSECSAGNITDSAADLSSSNAYTTFLAMNAILDDEKVPLQGRTAWVSPAFYNFLKLDSNFIKASDMAQEMLVSGVVGELDGVRIVKVPTSYLPAKSATTSKGAVMCIIAHQDAFVLPMRLEEYRTHQDPPGISGQLVEGRIVYDCFVLKRTVSGSQAKPGVCVLRDKYNA